MKNYLFPHIFQLIGWILFVPSFILGVLFFFSVTSSTYMSFDLPYISGVSEIVVNDFIIIGIALGALFIVCSKEKVEDEMTQSIRLSSLLNSIYVYVILLVFCTILINGVDYLLFVMVDLAILPILFVCNFRLEMHRYNKMFADEE